jgi:hypothetical protein
MRERKFENFQMYYQPYPIQEMMQQAEKDGMNFKDLFEPV